jgi:hypothetical protein
LTADAAEEERRGDGRIIVRKNGSTVEKIIGGAAERDLNHT